MKIFEIIKVPTGTIILFISVLYFPYYCHANASNFPIEIESKSMTLNVFNNFSFEQRFKLVVKLINKKGVSDFSKVEILYNKLTEDVEIEQAFSVKSDGRKIPVPTSKIFTKDQSGTPKYPTDTNTRITTICFQQIEVGDKIHYQFKKFRKIPAVKDQVEFLYTSEPYWKGYTDFQIFIPKDIFITIDKKGFIEQEHGIKSDKQFWRFLSDIKTNTAPETDAFFPVDTSNYISVSSHSSYAEAASSFVAGWKQKSKTTSSIKKLANELTSETTDPVIQVRNLYNWVSRNIKSVAVSSDIAGVVPSEADKVLADRYGDCKDHAVLLEALLRAKGIESTPALINISNSYTLPRIPSLVAFNHVITYVPLLNIYLDSASAYAPFGVLPSCDIDKMALLIYPEKVVRIPIPEKNLLASKQSLQVLPNGKTKVDAIEYFNGPCEVRVRASMAAQSGKSDEELINNFLLRHKESGKGELIRGNPENIEHPYEIGSKFVLDGNKDLLDAGLFKIPTCFSSGIYNKIKSISLNSTKTHSFFCESAQYFDEYEINFPLNFNIKSFPFDVDKSYGPFHYKSTYVLAGNVLHVKRHFSAKPQSLACKPEIFDSLKNISKTIQDDTVALVKFVPVDN